MAEQQIDIAVQNLAKFAEVSISVKERDGQVRRNQTVTLRLSDQIPCHFEVELLRSTNKDEPIIVIYGERENWFEFYVYKVKSSKIVPVYSNALRDRRLISYRGDKYCTGIVVTDRYAPLPQPGDFVSQDVIHFSVIGEPTIELQPIKFAELDGVISRRMSSKRFLIRKY